MIVVFFIFCRVFDGFFKLLLELFGIIIKVCLKVFFNLKVVIVVIVNVDVVDIVYVFILGVWKFNNDLILLCNFFCVW